MGNSEVGHMNLGAGRVLYQDFTRITKDIRDGRFADNPELSGAIAAARAAGGRVHVLGLLSTGGVHSHEDHLIAMAQAVQAAGVAVVVHAFLDGRDTPPQSAGPSLQRMEEALSEAAAVQVEQGPVVVARERRRRLSGGRGHCRAGSDLRATTGSAAACAARRS